MQQLCCLLFFSLSQYFWVIKMNKYKKRGEKRREERREERRGYAASFVEGDLSGRVFA